MKKRAFIGALAAFLLGLAATVIIGGIGFAISIRVSRNQTYVTADLPMDINNPICEITVKADKGNLNYALENNTDSQKGYKVSYKTSKNGSYTTAFNGYINAHQKTGWSYICYASGWSDRYFQVEQTTGLTAYTSHCTFYVKVN